MKLYKFIIILISVLFIVACGGGGSGNGGGFISSNDIKLSVTATRTSLPLNTLGEGPDQGGRFTTEIIIRATQSDGRALSLPEDSVAVGISGIDSGTIVTFLPEHFDQALDNVSIPRCAFLRGILTGFDEDTQTGTCTVQGGFQSQVTSLNAGIGCCIFIHTGGGNRPGRIRVTVSVPDPNNNEQLVTDFVDIEIGSQVGSGVPAKIITGALDNSTLFVQGLNQFDVKPFRVELFDEAADSSPLFGNFPVTNPENGINNVRVSITVSPTGNEFLTGLDGHGNLVDSRTSADKAINIQTVNGIANYSLHSASKAGVVVLRVASDRDNNVDDGIGELLFDELTTTISGGNLGSIAFLEPNVTLIEATGSSTGVFFNAANNNNTYSINVSARTFDRAGAPMGSGIPIIFRVIDSPVNGYPLQGHGEFVLRRDANNCTVNGVSLLGNPVESSHNFVITPTTCSDFNGSAINDLLVLLEGFHKGAYFISKFNSATDLEVNETFNSINDSGENVPYVIGRTSFGTFVTSVVTTGVTGIATTTLNYPIFKLNQSIILTATGFSSSAQEAVINVGATLETFYPAASDLRVVLDGNATTINLAANTTQTIVASVLDFNNFPVPASSIAYRVSGALNGVTVNGSLALSGSILTDANGRANITVFSKIKNIDAPVITFNIFGNGSNNSATALITPPQEINLVVTPLAFLGSLATVTALVLDNNGHPIEGVNITSGRLTGSSGVITPLIGTTDSNGIVKFFISGGITDSTYVVAFADGSSTPQIISSAILLPVEPPEIPAEVIALLTIPNAGLDFGDVTTGQTSEQRVLTLVNTGEARLFITDLGLSGGDSSFAVIPVVDGTGCNVGTSLAAASSCKFVVVFSPNQEGTSAASFFVLTNPQNALGEINIRGNGVAEVPGTTDRNIVVNPTQLTYLVPDSGVVSDPQAVTIFNDGIDPLTVTGIQISAGTSITNNSCQDCYAIDNSLITGICAFPQILQTGQQCSLGVVYTPTLGLIVNAGESEDATLNITSDDPDTPVSAVILTGTRTIIGNLEFIPDGAIVFVREGEQQLSIRNTSNEAIELGQSSLIGEDPESFQIDSTNDTCSNAVLLPGDDCVIEITLITSTLGNITNANLIIRVNSSSDLIAIPLSTSLATDGTVRRRLNVTIVGTGEVSSLVGITCPGDCAEDFSDGSTVVLTATPGTGFTFDSWVNCDIPNGTECNMTMDIDKDVTAIFIP